VTRLDEIPGVGVTAPTVIIVEVDNSIGERYRRSLTHSDTRPHQ
jgi:hypothetical protein